MFQLHEITQITIIYNENPKDKLLNYILSLLGKLFLKR